MQMRALLLAVFAFSSFAVQSAAVAQASPAVIQANRVPAHADFTARVQLKKTLPHWATAVRDRGPVTAGRSITVTINVARSPELQTAFEQLLDAQQNPNAPRYHQWLSPEEIGRDFGPTTDDLDALTAWVTAQGLTVTGVAPSRTFVYATGSVEAFAQAFHTSFRMFSLNGKPQLSAATEPSVPAALAPMIASIAGLTELHPHAMNHVAQPDLQARDHVAHPDYRRGTSNVLLPGDFATIFDLNPLYTANIKGAGQKVAVIGRSRVTLSDTTSFEQIAGISPINTPNIVIATTGSDPGIVDNDESESDLDLQRVIGTAPAVTADLVISGPSNTADGIDIAMQYEIQTLRDPIMSLSYGLCENDADAGSRNSINSLFSQAAAEGISIFVSSGDSGAAACETSFQSPSSTQTLNINYLCATPYATCVGGTQFNDPTASVYWSSVNDSTNRSSAQRYIPEGAWNESQQGFVAATGGGVSRYTAKPSYQAGPGVPADSFRDVPDVSFPAAGHDGYFVCEADLPYSDGSSSACSIANGVVSGGLIFSGTSAAAPSWAGVAALLNQKIGTAQGNLNPLIYRLGALSASNPFHDVTVATSGIEDCDITYFSLCNNSTPSATTSAAGLAGYAVGPGFDLATGWGSPDVNAFITTAAGAASLHASTSTLTANPATTTTARTVVFTTTVTGANGTPAGTVQFSSNGVALGTPVNLVNGTAVSPAESFPTIGTYTISAVYSGSSVYTDSSAPSITLDITASGTTPSVATLTASATSGFPSTPFTFTVQVAGSGSVPTGNVQFKLNGANFGNPVTLSATASAQLPATLLAAGSNVVTAFYSGDNTFAGDLSNAVTVTITTLQSVTTIAPTTQTTNPNGYFVIQGKVVDQAGTTSVPTGSLILYVNNTAIGSATLINGAVQVGLTGVPVGTYNLYWLYPGDGDFSGSQSAPVTYTVSASAVASLTLTPSVQEISTAVGVSATNNIAVTQNNGFTGNVSFTCSAVFNGTSSLHVVLPACSASPATMAIGPTSVPQPFAVTLTTTAPHAIERAALPSFPRRATPFGGIALAGLALFAFPAIRRRRSWSALASVLLLIAVAGLSGCGGGGSTGGGGGGGGAQTGTPSGVYTVSVNGGGAGTTFTLTVQ